MNRHNRLKDIFKNYNGILRTKEAIAKGIYSKDLAQMQKKGIVKKIGRGLYHLADMPTFAQPDISIIAKKIPQGVICLISALSFHEITTQIPHQVSIALKAGSEKPRLDFPPTKFFWFSGQAFSTGIEKHLIDNAEVKVYSAAKTIADCFKFRNKIGLDVAIEALKLARETKKASFDDIIKYARINRVEKVMKPYLESI
jgi:predicted transcriptional regulator of viral defense system